MSLKDWKRFTWFVTACESSFSTETVMQVCHGKRRCSLTASSSTFGNPCSPRSHLYLRIVYTCGTDFHWLVQYLFLPNWLTTLFNGIIIMCLPFINLKIFIQIPNNISLLQIIWSLILESIFLYHCKLAIKNTQLNRLIIYIRWFTGCFLSTITTDELGTKLEGIGEKLVYQI